MESMRGRTMMQFLYCGDDRILYLRRPHRPARSFVGLGSAALVSLWRKLAADAFVCEFDGGKDDILRQEICATDGHSFRQHVVHLR